MAKAARKRTRVKPAKASVRLVRRSRSRLPRSLRVNVRAPRVHVTTPAPQVSVTSPVPAVQVEAPTVTIEAPNPIVIPAPMVTVDVEAEETADEASMKALRKELGKCMKQNQTIELLLASDWGAEGRRYRIGNLVRVEEGIIELRTSSAVSILIPLNRIVAVIPNLQSEAAAVSDDEDEQEPISLKWGDDPVETVNRHLVSG